MGLVVVCPQCQARVEMQSQSCPYCYADLSKLPESKRVYALERPGPPPPPPEVAAAEPEPEVIDVEPAPTVITAEPLASEETFREPEVVAETLVIEEPIVAAIEPEPDSAAEVIVVEETVELPEVSAAPEVQEEPVAAEVAVEESGAKKAKKPRTRKKKK
ncbi:MAG TPA: hypothetical protein DCY27_12865 [Desulfobacterales bacterium]|nr:hypothetical protein [Desulfobacterales bacterium]